MINFHRGATASEASGERHAIVNGVLTRATRFRVRRHGLCRDTTTPSATSRRSVLTDIRPRRRLMMGSATGIVYVRVYARCQPRDKEGVVVV